MKKFAVALCHNETFERFTVPAETPQEAETTAQAVFRAKNPKIRGHVRVFSTEPIHNHGRSEFMRRRIEESINQIKTNGD